MSRFQAFDDEVADETSIESTIKFVLTLIVTTMIVAAAVFVLGCAVLDATGSGSAHRAAIATIHAHT